MPPLGLIFMSDRHSSHQEIQARIQEAEACLKNQEAHRAEAILDELIANDAKAFRAHYYKAVCRRLHKDHGSALEHLHLALALQPDYGRAWQEIGHNHRDQDHTKESIEAYRRAVELNPGLLAAWRSLASLYQADGRSDEAAMAEANAHRLERLPKALQAVTSLMHEKRLFKAEHLCRQFLKKKPSDVEGMRLLAAIGIELNVLDDAEFLLESALEFEPNFDLGRLDYIKVLHKRQKYQKAFDQATELRRRLPNNVASEMAYATEAAAIGRYDEALTVLESLIKVAPHPEQIYMQQGHAFKTTGQENQAIEAYQHAARSRPSLGDAWWSLANMKTHRFSDGDISRMENELGIQALNPTDRYHMHFALGKAYEDQQAFEEAFAHYAKGNALKKSELRYSADRMQADFDRQKDFFTPERVHLFNGLGHPAPDPIFIVGLPRAGSTLIEQILASHSQIDGTLELPNILAMVHRLNGRQLVQDTPNYPHVLADLSKDQLQALGQQYLDETKIHRASAPYFTDKMPNNFRHIGLIKTILPDARIIDARRHPMACCFSGFKQLFAEGQEFSYGLEDLGRYYGGYVDLMDHWHQCYPGEILQVDYEAVVDDLEGEVKRLLDYLQLPFEPECISYYQTHRSVRTASAQQVRQPIYRSGVEQWKQFETWLGPLKAALGQLAEP